DADYSVWPAAGFLLIYTRVHAANFRIVRAPESDPGPAHWADWLPHRDAVFVDNVDAFKDFVVVSERSGGLRRLRVTDLRTNRSHYVTFPEVAYGDPSRAADRKSTRLNSSHVKISYAVFCLKKKTDIWNRSTFA